MDLDGVASAGELEAERGRGAFLGIIVGETAAEEGCLGADDGVGSGVEVLGAVEDGETDGVLLDGVGIAGEGLFGEVAEEFLVTGGGGEGGGGKDAVELGLDFGRISL
jgi:hypothetical protein